MKRLILIISLGVNLIAHSQATDYSKIKFQSKIYEYKKELPRVNELGIERESISEIVNLLANTLYNDKQKREISSKLWLAFSNPKVFDFVYKDFAVKTSNDWGYKNSNGELVLEPNPYLTEWTFSNKEFAYFQIVSRKILEHYKLIAFSEDAEAVKSSFSKLLVTKSIDLQDPDEDDWAYSYLETVNSNLKKKGLVALVSKGDYDVLVCKLDRKDQISNLFELMEWEFIEP